MRTIKIRHDGSEYCVMDSASPDGVREITVLVEPGSPIVAGIEPGVSVPTSEGPRVPAARWCDGQIEPLIDLTDQQLKILDTVISNFLVDPPKGRKNGGGAVFYFNSSQNGDHLFTLSPAHPHGLAVNIYSSAEKAERSALDRLEEPGRYATKKTDDLPEFLCRAANQGFAGAVLDDCAPIFFCLDGSGKIHFLKIFLDEDEETMEALLQPDGKWIPFEGDKDLNLFGDQEDIDAASHRLLGDIPFLGWEEGTTFFVTLEESDSPDSLKRFPLNEVVVTDDCQEMVVLFFDRTRAVEFMEGRGVATYDVADVNDMREFVEKASGENLAVVLEPGNHRVMSGIFWFTEGSVILDSFSGFWRLEEEHGFTRLS